MSSQTTIPSTGRLWSLDLEDKLGKLVLLVLFTWSMIKSVGIIPGLIEAREATFEYLLLVTTRFASIAFLGLIVWMTLSRKPAIDVAPGIHARVVAFMGTFILMTLPLIPAVEINKAQFYFASGLVLSGTILSVWCLWWLGTAFSVMASARHLVIAGPYKIVRHPLYVTEAIFIFGLVLFNGSLAACVLCAVQCYFQYCRMKHEEIVLEKAFPEYSEYKKQVPMFVPKIV